MASDVVDLISSSPLPSRNTVPSRVLSSSPAVRIKQRVEKPHLTRHYDKCHQSGSPSYYRTRTTHADELQSGDASLSDVFDQPRAKRPRITPSEIKRSSKSAGKHLKGGVSSLILSRVDDDERPCTRTALEPIELSSSPQTARTVVKDTSATGNQSPSSRPKHARCDGFPPGEDDDSSASISTLPSPVSRHRAAESMDPMLDSSSRPYSLIRHDCKERLTSIHEAPPIFNSLKRQDVEKASNEQLQGKGAVAFRDEVISLASSSVKSNDTDDDDLPDLPQLALAQGRAQSSTRRRQKKSSVSPPRLSTAAVSKQRRPRKTAAERSAEKEKMRQEREGIKAAKAAAKQRAAAMAEVNKLRTDKKVSTSEMIVDLPPGMTLDLQTQVQEMLHGLGVEHTSQQGASDTLIKWRRKVTSRFNDETGCWEPIAPRISEEQFALLVVSASDLVAMILNHSLVTRVEESRSQHIGKQLVFLVQGLTTWFRKNRNARNRQFASGVRGSSQQGAVSSVASPEHIDENVVEDAMLAMQVDYNVLIHHTNVVTETARWVINFTQHISTIPYRNQRDHSVSVARFCMDSGQVRTGDSTRDTYVRLLQEMARVTAPIAYGIAAEFQSVVQLVNGLEQYGPELLGNVKKASNKDGALSDRSIGQAVCRRVHKIFTGTDEDSTDV